MDIEIDIDALDTEWLKQPRMYLDAAERATELLAYLSKEKDQLELTKSTLGSAIRDDPEAFGLSKITEAVVANTIIIQKEYMAQAEETRAAKHSYESALSKVKALDHRKKALENLVQLYIGQYFSSPKEKKEEGQEGIKKMAERNSERKARRTITRKQK